MDFQAPPPGNPDPQFEAWPAEIKERCFVLFKQSGGTDLKTISEASKVPVATLKNWSSRHKWRARMIADIPIIGKHKKVSIVDNSHTEAALKADRMTLPEKQEEYKKGMAAAALRVPALIENMTDTELVRNADKVAKLDSTARKALNLEEQKATVVVHVGLLANAIPARPALAAPTTDVELIEDTPPLDLDEVHPEPIQESVSGLA